MIFFLQNIFTAPLVEPRDGDGAFYGKNCVATLVYQPGHWVVYAKLGQIWWCLELNASYQRNPFENQTLHCDADLVFVILSP